mmetsp:Transcript_119342/g.380578  ORF Transcript_119342/g.380578 Transcript_119342/m.380578 type:complete len:220 (-) Transcript_119342:1096-1755(-)
MTMGPLPARHNWVCHPQGRGLRRRASRISSTCMGRRLPRPTPCTTAACLAQALHRPLPRLRRRHCGSTTWVCRACSSAAPPGHRWRPWTPAGTARIWQHFNRARRASSSSFRTSSVTHRTAGPPSWTSSTCFPHTMSRSRHAASGMSGGASPCAPPGCGGTSARSDAPRKLGIGRAWRPPSPMLLPSPRHGRPLPWSISGSIAWLASSTGRSYGSLGPR